MQYVDDYAEPGAEGMSLLEYFAAAALQGILAGSISRAEGPIDLVWVAHEAHEAARTLLVTIQERDETPVTHADVDALLNAREEQ
jgi:hypothetical protein